MSDPTVRTSRCGSLAGYVGANPKDGLTAASPESSGWIRSRPTSIQQLMRAWPPFCRVCTKPGLTFMSPPPGEVGWVVSYLENGNVRVANTINNTAGECDPDDLELIECLDGFTQDDIARVLDS